MKKYDTDIMYKSGFNNAFTIAQSVPKDVVEAILEKATVISKDNPDDLFARGIIAGIGKGLKEKDQQRTKNRLNELENITKNRKYELDRKK